MLMGSAAAKAKHSQKSEHGEHKPEISVIVPVYNSEKYLAQTLDSLINQTFTDIEIICVNDGSTDGSSDILQHYSQLDKRIRVFENRRLGPGRSRNFGIDKAQGTFITFMDHDDFAETTWLEKMHLAARRNSAKVVFCYAKEYYEDSQKSETIGYPQFVEACIKLDDATKSVLAGTFLPPWTKLVNLKFLRKHDIRFAENGNRFDDVLYHFFIVHYAEKVAFVDEPLYLHRVSHGSITAQSLKDRDMYFDHFKTLDEIITKAQADQLDYRIVARIMPLVISYTFFVQARLAYMSKIMHYINKCGLWGYILFDYMPRALLRQVKKLLLWCGHRKFGRH
jgi:glycosyltransferase involved in cell wall biosynthesis